MSDHGCRIAVREVLPAERLNVDQSPQDSIPRREPAGVFCALRYQFHSRAIDASIACFSNIPLPAI